MHPSSTTTTIVTPAKLIANTTLTRIFEMSLTSYGHSYAHSIYCTPTPSESPAGWTPQVATIPSMPKSLEDTGLSLLPLPVTEDVPPEVHIDFSRAFFPFNTIQLEVMDIGMEAKPTFEVSGLLGLVGALHSLKQSSVERSTDTEMKIETMVSANVGAGSGMPSDRLLKPLKDLPEVEEYEVYEDTMDVDEA